MAINRNINNVTLPLSWNGDQVATLRGLTPDDIADIVVSEGESVADLLKDVDGLDMQEIARSGRTMDANQLLASAPKMMGQLAFKAPSLMACVIAKSGVDKGDDLAETTAFIRENWSLPLQCDALAKICQLTFAGPEGFRMFVGNVLALVGTLNALTSANAKPSIEQEPSDAG